MRCSLQASGMGNAAGQQGNARRRGRGRNRRAAGAACEGLEGRVLLATVIYNYTYVPQVYPGVEVTRNESQWQSYPAGMFGDTTLTINLGTVPKYTYVSVAASGAFGGTMGSFSVGINGNAISTGVWAQWLCGGGCAAEGTSLSVSLSGTGWSQGAWILTTLTVSVELAATDVVVPPPSCPVPAAGNNGAGAAASGAGGVDYGSGSLQYRSDDLLSEGSGGVLGQSREYANVPEQTGRDEAGVGYVSGQRPFLRNESGAIRVVQDARRSLYFDASGGVYTPRFFVKDQLVYSSGTDTYTLVSPDGTVLSFYGFGGYGTPEARKGQIQSRTDPAGNTTSYSYHSSSGLLESITRSAGGVSETLAYSRVGGTGFNRNQVAMVTLSRGGSTVGKAEYSYYQESDSGGSDMDLKLVTLYEGESTVVGRKYYRYWEQDGSSGYRHGLKYVFDEDAYARLAAAYADPTAASDTAVAPYADHYYEYGSGHRVSKHVAQNAGCSCAGGRERTRTPIAAAATRPGPIAGRRRRWRRCRTAARTRCI